MKRWPTARRDLARALGVVLFSCGLVLGHAAGQATSDPGVVLPGPWGEPVEGSRGLELALYGDLAVVPGRALVLSGTAYATVGLGTLEREPGASVEAQLYVASTERAERFLPVPGAAVRVSAASDGDFTLAMPVPARLGVRPHVVVRIASAGGAQRAFGFALSPAEPWRTIVRADRRRYEPGETAHLWVRVLDAESGAPVRGEPLAIVVRDGLAAAVASAEVVTGEGGSATLDVPLSASASGSHTVTVRRSTASTRAPALAETSFTVETRRTARILATLELGRRWASPGQRVPGTVTVTTPSRAPLPGAAVEVRARDRVVAAGRTDDAGVLRFELETPAFLDVETRTELVTASVEHALGAASLDETYLLARAPWQIELTPEAGALGVGVPSRVIVSVTDPVGEPIPAGVEVEVRGPGLRGGRSVGRTDAHGLLSYSPSVPASSVATSEGGACAGEVAASYLVEVRTSPPIEARLCVRASRRAELALELGSPVAAPGTSVRVSVARRPGLEARPVLLELHDEHRTYAHARVAARAGAGTIAIPAEARGVLAVRGRLLAPDDAVSPVADEGARMSGEEATAQLVVRPTDAFALAAAVDPPLVRVRETSRVSLTATPAPGRSWAAVLVRDEAQHEGEVAFAYETLGERLRESVRGALAPGDELLVRLALAADPPEPVRGASPTDWDPWDDPFGASWDLPGNAVLSDPIAAREELRRSVVGPWMGALVRLVADLGQYPPDVRAAIVEESGGRQRFSARALEVAAQLGVAPADEPPRVLGGLALEAAMLTEADPSFSFDTVSRLVARWQLVRLLSSLWALTSTADVTAQRAIAGQPVSRWLAILVALGWVESRDLRDPWGSPFTFSCAPGLRPRVLLSTAAAECELGSPGPDRRAGTADDVVDPFARVVPEGTLFALASHEDEVMARLSRIAPGEAALVAMAVAYGELGLAALDETVEAALYAHPSEAADAELASLFGTMVADSLGLGGVGAIGHGSGTGSGYGYGSGSGSLRGRSGVAPRVRVALSAVVREDLPATLFFAGEVPLDAAGRAVVPVRAADAMSSYHVEAVAWSESGWTTSARTTLRVDQDVEIDAPVPEVLHAGDEVHLTLRLRSRARDALDVRIAVETEGPVTMTSPERMSLPAGETAVAEVTLRATGVGNASVLLRASLPGGEPLDAIRRRVAVWEDARTARRAVRALVRDRGELTLEVPAAALPRSEGTLRVSGARAIFGTPSIPDRPYGEWAEALRGGPPPEADRIVGEGDEAERMAFAIGALWESELLDDETAARGLRAVTAAATGVPSPSDGSGTVEDRVATAVRAEPAIASWLLLGLAPAIRSSARAHLRADLDAVAGLLRERVAAEGAHAADAPETWARVAAALALAGGGEDTARASEMMRRLGSRTIRVRDMAWIEPAGDDGSAEPRVEPTALTALALVYLGRAADALPFVTALADVARGIDGWSPRSAALARAAALALIPAAPAAPAVTVDGAPVELASGTTLIASLAALSSPGRHTVTLVAPGLALLEAEATFGLPWTLAPARPPRVEVVVEGEVGARDTRAALVVRVRNVGARALREPSVRILLPSGAELEEAERTRIRTYTGRAPALERDELVVPARPLLPGRTLVFPLRVRWSLAGALRGLGLAVTDGAIPADPDAAFVVPSRVVVIAAEGEEPALEIEGPEAEPPPVPRARDLVVRPLAESMD